MLLLCRLFFFFKQKTAYEMRISDWSSDVCSSDLATTVAQAAPGVPGGASALAAFDPLAAGPASVAAQPADPNAVQNRQDQKEAFLKAGSTETRNSGNLALPASPYQVMAGTVIAGALVTGIKSDLPRSEEHTSELQSLMRHSYAGFSL